MSSRQTVLERVRAALEDAPPPSAIPRDYRSDSEGGVQLFIARLEHYDAAAHRAAPGELDEVIRALLRLRGVGRIVAPDGVPESWLGDVQPLRDSPRLDPPALDAADGVITTCALAIADTGTIVLDGFSGMGRRALTLVPDYHLCVVRSEQIVGSLPQAIARLDPIRPLTFISGPSATVDIEMVRVSGVHGPRRLDVVIAG